MLEDVLRHNLCSVDKALKASAISFAGVLSDKMQYINVQATNIDKMIQNAQ